MKTRHFAAGLGVVATLAVACAGAGHPSGAQSASSYAATPWMTANRTGKSASGTANQRRGNAPVRPETAAMPMTGVAVEQSLAEACGVNLPETFFEFDSAKLEPQASYTLNKIADCMILGSFQGQKIVVVGRADPRGSSAYNLKLGRSRANSVKQFLERRGVDGDRIIIESQGQENALKIPRAYPFERRVDIRRAEPSEAAQRVSLDLMPK